MSASTVLRGRSTISRTRLCVRISNCSPDFLSMWVSVDGELVDTGQQRNRAAHLGDRTLGGRHDLAPTCRAPDDRRPSGPINVLLYHRDHRNSATAKRMKSGRSPWFDLHFCFRDLRLPNDNEHRQGVRSEASGVISPDLLPGRALVEATCRGDAALPKRLNKAVFPLVRPGWSSRQHLGPHDDLPRGPQFQRFPVAWWLAQVRKALHMNFDGGCLPLPVEPERR